MRFPFLQAISVLVLASPLEPQTPTPPPRVLTVAPTASTRREAVRIVRLCRWMDTTEVAGADLVLVVVRSSRSHPLAPGYDNLKWLRDDAAAQLNELGAQYHVYLFTERADHGFLQRNHRSYDVVEDQPFADPEMRERAAANSGWNCFY
ncbi:MAG TPA: hypothetical protein VF187_00195 [Gemmatimonadales bacterium]